MMNQLLLPEEYSDKAGNRPRVGDWGFIRYKPEKGSLHPAYLWQITEPAPGQYELNAYGYELTLPFTTAICADFRLKRNKINTQISLADYPELLKRFHDKGIAAYFEEKADRPGIRLFVGPPRGSIRIKWLPSVEQAKQDVNLLGKWVDQIIWMVSHPRKYEVLQWATESGYSVPYGTWPELTSPSALDKAAKELWHPYQSAIEQESQEDEKLFNQEVLPTSNLFTGQLPPSYRNIKGDRTPYIVGEWIATFHLKLSTVYNDSPFSDAYLWRLQEPEPGLYTAVSYGGKYTVTMTPENSVLAYPLGVEISERLALDKYPRYMTLYHNKGVSAYFYVNAHRQTVLRVNVLSPAVQYCEDIVAEPFMLDDMERNPGLLYRWLDQMMWCMLNPEQSKILMWALHQGSPVFGEWPELYLPLELAHGASLLSTIYEAAQKRARTPEEIAAEQQAIANKIELNHQTELLSKLRQGLLDQSISPHIDSLLDGTGIDKPE